VVAGWCPYRYGRWAWVEPWGWTWVDDEPWGFAPFHYGRWVQIGPRWGWLPGPIGVYPVYGPAFVAFVGGDGFSVGIGGGTVAWFPLGPGEPFFPWYHHSAVYLRQVNITNVRNINIRNINVTNINDVHYRYRTVAATAVSANAFRSSEPVSRNLVRVDPQQLERGSIIPHPEIQPAATALRAGAPATRPPVPAARPMVQPIARRPGETPATARVAPSANPRPNEARPPAENTRTNEARPPAQAERPVPQPPARNSVPAQNRPALVSRSPSPPARLPFTQTAPAMQQHPGRPLEPQQRQNLREGRPAGPMQDREFPPHAAPMRSAPAPHASAPHGEPSRH